VLGVGWSFCGWVFWAVLVQECLEGCFLPLQAGCRVVAGSGSSYSLFQVPWSELKKFSAEYIHSMRACDGLACGRTIF